MALSTDPRFVQGDGSPCGVRESYIALGAVDLANIIRQCRPWKQDAEDAEERPLVDIAPSVLRDIYASVCNWVSFYDEGPSTL